jgi:DNA replication protein DnaC
VSSALDENNPDDLCILIGQYAHGNETNVMAEVMMSRYPLFIHRKMLTHATTNLSAEELENLYGNRVRSRMREMFNLIAFVADVADKRK